MKSFHSKLSGVAPFIFFPALIIIRRSKKLTYVLVSFMVITLSSCYLNFYRTNTKPSIDAATVANLKLNNKYFIIHFSDTAYGLQNVHLSGDTLQGSLVALPPEHSGYLHPVSPEKSRVKRADQMYTLVEVHLYTAAANAGNTLFSAPVSSFNRADVYELNREATRKNHIWSTVGIVTTGVAVVVLVAYIVSASAANQAEEDCNCPQLYMESNGAYSFTSGLYSGAVYSTLERIDYLPLNTVPYDTKDISFKIANAENEEQFINKVELLQVNHAAGQNVLADRHGDIFTYRETIAPLSALTGENNTVQEILQQTDEQYYSFTNNANENGFSDVRLSFDKPGNTSHAKLIIHARNTYWGGLIHKEFISYFGDDFEKWRSKQEKADPKELEKWQTDQALPLMVYIKTTDGWKFVDYYPLIGNTASRDMIMNIDTKNIPGNTIEIKLETAFRFWDLDFAGIDYSDNKNFTVKTIEPVQIIKSDNTDESGVLQSSDNQYAHLQNDEFISFKYSIPQATGNEETSYILISGGYYHSIEHLTGKADYNKLYKFKKQGYFDKFSREKYKEAQEVAAVMGNLNKTH
ncbi:MAG TPA: hypothetical protein VFW07_12775 [Parafilimonas sp.]|nr:hypothetical protein [Parafilimonas sp.]